MALDFPANPVDGEAFASYVWNESVGVWQGREESATVAVMSPTAPVSANNGDIWFNTARGIAYVYYDDGSSSQWVEVVTSGTPELATKADVTYVDSQDNLKANLSGASFTGNVNVGSSGTLINASNGTATFTTSDSGKVVVAVQGASSQSANLQEWKDSSGTAKSWVDSSGRFFSVNTGSAATVALSNEVSGVNIKSTSTTAASMSFHVPGIVATNMGLNPNYQFSIGGWSLPADSLTIDLGGRVKMPNQPLFSGTDTRTINLTGVVLNSSNCFNQVDYNVGNCFNASTGRFTAPVDGYYDVSLHVADTTSTTTNIRIRKNGASNSGPLAEAYNQTGGGSINVMVRSFIYCAVGDYIDFEASRINTLGGVQHKRFLIRLLQ
jgi:hypothetical protein